MKVCWRMHIKAASADQVQMPAFTLIVPHAMGTIGVG